MTEKIKTDVDKLLLIMTTEKKFPIDYNKIELFLNFETRSSVSTPVFIFSAISQILKRKIHVL